MNHAFSLTFAAGGGGGALRVLGAGYAGRLATTRAGPALAQDADGNWQPATADTPRFTGSLRRLLVEGARTNSIRNPRAEGATPGTPGSMPTNWQDGWAAGFEALTSQIVGSGTEGGIPYLDYRLSGTPTASRGDRAISFETTTAIAAASGDSWAASLFVRQVAGGTGGFGATLRMFERSSTGAQVAAGSVVGFTPATSGALPACRVSGVRVLSGGASVACVNFGLGISYTSGTPFDVTLRIGAPQLELGTFASSPILPAAGSPAATTRAADLPFWAPAGGFGSQGSLVVRAVLPQAAPAGLHQGLWQLDDGTDQNRIQLRNSAAGSAIAGAVDAAGSTLATLAGGSMTAGTPFRAAFAWAPGDQALCLSGGTPATATASLPAGLTRLLVGHASTQLSRAAFGEVELLDYRPTRLSNAQLQALANAA